MTAWLLFVFVLCQTAALLAGGEPVVTYMGDPSTSLTVNWQVLGAKPEEARVYYDSAEHHGKLGDYTSQAAGEISQIPGLDDRWLCRVTLENLTPGSVCYLVAGSPGSGFSKEIKVRTISADDSPLRFVTGGDMGTSDLTRQLLAQSARLSPDFAVVGGDIAYADGKLEKVGAWDIWLRYYTREMITPDGFTIPLVLAIGNHEVTGGFGKSKSEARFFFGFFGQDPERSYFSRRFGRNLALLILDTGHVASHQEQVGWIERQLADFQNAKYKVAIYHVPLYPSHRNFDGKYSKLGREQWAPLFDKYALTVAFENHDHTFKRTHRIKNGAVAEDGTLYLGDGCWGKGGRAVPTELPWYLRVASSTEHFWVADLGPEKAVYRAVDVQGRVFDVYPESEPGAVEAREVLAQMASFHFLPDGALKAEAFKEVGEEWSGGETTLTYRNIFDRSAVFSVGVGGEDESPIRMSNEAGDPVRLEPGEEAVRRVTFSTTDGRPLPRNSLKLRLEVKAEVAPVREGDPPLVFQGSPAVSFRSAEAPVEE